MFLKHNFLGILWALFILVVCLMNPGKLPDSGIVGFDKAAHFTVFAILAFLWARGFGRQTNIKLLHSKPLLTTVLFGTLYGIGVEALQGTVFVSRDFEWMDMAANAAGCLAGIGSFKLVERKPNPDKNGKEEESRSRP